MRLGFIYRENKQGKLRMRIRITGTEGAKKAFPSEYDHGNFPWYLFHVDEEYDVLKYKNDVGQYEICDNGKARRVMLEDVEIVG